MPWCTIFIESIPSPPTIHMLSHSTKEKAYQRARELKLTGNFPDIMVAYVRDNTQTKQFNIEHNH
jgi:hypothetical protein